MRYNGNRIQAAFSLIGAADKRIDRDSSDFPQSTAFPSRAKALLKVSRFYDGKIARFAHVLRRLCESLANRLSCSGTNEIGD